MIGKYRSTFGIGDVFAAARATASSQQRLRDHLTAICGCRHVILFQSARCALRALLGTLGGGGKAVVPAYNCIAVPEAVEGAGWQPVFADVASGDINMTPATLEERLPADARVVLLTHQFGLPSDIDPIVALCRRRGMLVVEDAAPAIGARYRGRPVGQFGDAAVISLHLTKVVGVGRLGALLTNDDTIARNVSALQVAATHFVGNLVDFTGACAWWAATRPSVYGALRSARSLLQKDELYETVVPNGTFPADLFTGCSNYVAGLACRQMDALDANLSTRRDLARIYADELRDVNGIAMLGVPDGAEPAWMQFPIFVENKEACYRFLLNQGVDLNWTFRYSCGVSYNVRHTPNADRAARTVLGLPTYPGLPEQEVRRICDLLRRYAEK